MSRNLEKEYKELMKEEMPDLWGRIEAGLEPKQTGIKKRKLWRKYGPWCMTAAAACLCLAVTVPYLFNEILSEQSDFWNASDVPNNASSHYNAGQQGGEGADYAGEATSDFEGIYNENEAPSDGTGSFEDWDHGDAAAEENYGSAYEAEEGMLKIRGQVIEVFEEEGIVVYTVEIVETEEGFQAGEIIVLKEEGMLTEKLEVGEVYQFLFDNMAYSENIPEYWIYDAIRN
ncbi:MAG: hypothetical protein J1E03_01490 [Acetatifactor sp.]|nr:hypothetical protein [Acetatifactor sp.]